MTSSCTTVAYGLDVRAKSIGNHGEGGMAQHIGDLTKAVLKQATVHIDTNYEPRTMLCVLTNTKHKPHPKPYIKP